MNDLDQFEDAIHNGCKVSTALLYVCKRLLNIADQLLTLTKALSQIRTDVLAGKTLGEAS